MTNGPQQNGHHKHGKKFFAKKPSANGDKHYGDESKHDTSNGSTFVERFRSLPIISDSIATVSSYIMATPYSEFVLDKSVNTFNTVHKFAQPYVEPLHQHLQPHLEKVDSLAVKALDSLEETFPIVNKPTSDIIDSVTGPPLQYYANVKKTVETKVAEPAAQTVSGLAKNANHRASHIVDNFEYYVEHLFPADNVPKPAYTTDVKDVNQVVRFYDITATIPTRFTIIVNAHLEQHHIPHTAEDFKKLKETNAFLRETTARLEALNGQLHHFAEVSRTSIVAGFDSTVTTVTANEKVQQVTQEIVATLEKAADFAKQHGPTLPSFIQVRLDPLIGFVDNQYKLIAAELKRPDALPSQKAKNVLALTQQQVLPLMKKSLDDLAEYIRNYQQMYLHESERVLDGFKTSLKGLGVPVK